MNEVDPTGRNPSEAGAKLDAGKVRPDLVFDAMALALLEVCKVATMGATKYSDNGWYTVPNGINRYRAAGDRHRLYRARTFLDPESKLPHLAHQAWNVLAELQLVIDACNEMKPKVDEHE